MQHNVLIENFKHGETIQGEKIPEGRWVEFLKFNTTEAGVRKTLAHAAKKSIIDIRITVVNTTAADCEEYEAEELKEIFGGNW